MKKLKIHRESKINKKTNEVLRHIYKFGAYALTGYALVYQCDFDLFLNITILFGVYEFFIKKI
jgi:hypothetical protein